MDAKTTKRWIRDENVRHKKALAIIERASKLEFVEILNHDHITMATSSTLEGYSLLLHSLRKILGNYTLLSYDCLYAKTVVMRYHFYDADLKIHLYCAEGEKLLDQVTNGRCHIATTTREETKIVCARGD